MNRWLVVATVTTVVGLVGASAAAAGTGPKQGVFDANDQVWACGPTEGPTPPNHCINTRSQGNTGVIKVFAPDDRWPQEGISFDPKSDSRPCPHDPGATDGTWWTPPGQTGFWVCHHRP